MPLTRGSSGPTITSPILFSIVNTLISSKLFGSRFTLLPIFAVPALPGVIKRLSHDLLCLTFHESVCSLPPDPIIKIFIFKNMI